MIITRKQAACTIKVRLERVMLTNRSFLNNRHRKIIYVPHLINAAFSKIGLVTNSLRTYGGI